MLPLKCQDVSQLCTRYLQHMIIFSLRERTPPVMSKFQIIRQHNSCIKLKKENLTPQNGSCYRVTTYNGGMTSVQQIVSSKTRLLITWSRKNQQIHNLKHEMEKQQCAPKDVMPTPQQRRQNKQPLILCSAIGVHLELSYQCKPRKHQGSLEIQV